MPQHDRRRIIGLGLVLAFAALAPAQQPQQQEQQPPAPARPAAEATPAELARARAEAGAKAYDLAWSYYSQDRIDADKVYRWSRRAWEADVAAAADKAGRVAAAETHAERMRKLEAKVTRIRRIGFGTSLDVAEVEYYRIEAEAWLAEARDR